ncbi:MAG: PEP-CTERM sorting domain-containing protein [bacterium]
MRKLVVAGLALWLGIALSSAALASPVLTMVEPGPEGLLDGYPDTYLVKLSAPDYWQRDPAYGGFPNGGAAYCTPTSISNSIMWFDDHGWEDLVVDTADPKKDQFDLIEVLAGPDYCNTSPTGGSSVSDYVPGLQDYFDDSAYGTSPGFVVKYQGLAYTGDEWTGVYAPQEDWIKAELSRCEDVILRVGWYYETSPGVIERYGGHCVTFVGYDDTGQSYNPGDIIIHDPDDGTAAVTHDNYAVSTLWIDFGMGPQPFMLIENYGGADFAIVDGAIAASPLPEPCSMLLLSLGLGGIGIYRRRKRAA